MGVHLANNERATADEERCICTIQLCQTQRERLRKWSNVGNDDGSFCFVFNFSSPDR